VAAGAERLVDVLVPEQERERAVAFRELAVTLRVLTGDRLPREGGGGDPGCPPNEQVYITTEGASVCTPIPFSNNPGMEPCPAGYAIDLASEGQFCVPSE